MNRLPPHSEPDEAAQEQASLFVLGLLPPAEAAAFERARRASPGLGLLVEEMRAGLGEVVREEAAAAPPPPAGLRGHLLEALAGRAPSDAVLLFPAPAAESAARPALLRPRFGFLPWAVAAGFALAAGLFAWRMLEAQAALGDSLARAEDAERRATENDRRLAAAAARVGDADVRLTTAVNRAAELEVEAARLREDASKPVPRPTPPAPELASLRSAVLRPSSGVAPAANTNATVVWEAAQNRGMLTVTGLPPAPAGRNYQLWVIDPAQPTAPVSAGVFQVNAAGVTRVLFHPAQAMPRAEQFAVSVETTGSKPLPEGPVWLAGG